MPSLRFQLPEPVIEVPDWPALRAELQIDEGLTAEVLAAAEQAAKKPLPEVEDRRDLPLFTLDPEGSKDLDQAMFLEETPSGFSVHYAIADVTHFVNDKDPLDVRAHRLGQTFYGPTEKVPLYPFVISEGAGSLLPDEDRAAVLWIHSLDKTGELIATEVKRAIVRSRQQISYDNPHGNPEQFRLLQEIGELRQNLARARNAVDLPSPEQVVDDGPNGPSLHYRATTPAEMWNSQISLLTGIAAAQLMIKGKVGVLRTLPHADEEAIRSLRLSAEALGVEWPQGASYGDVISAIDPDKSHGPAFLNLAARMLRGASYSSFDGTLPDQLVHSGVGAPYAHCTAPLRRLVDRYVSEVCLALSAGTEIPEWVGANLSRLPKEMSSSDQRSHSLNKAVIEATEAFVMSRHLGQGFRAVVVEKYEGEKARLVLIQLAEPAVRAKCLMGQTQVELGAHVRVRCAAADVKTRTVTFDLV